MGSVDLSAIQSAKSEASRRKGAVGANWDKIIVPAVFAVIVLIFYSIDSKFLSATNILNIMSQVSILMVVTVAASLVIFTGGFDLSAGSVVALTGVAAALVVDHTGSVPMGLSCGLLVGLAVGAANGFVVGYRRRFAADRDARCAQYRAWPGAGDRGGHRGLFVSELVH